MEATDHGMPRPSESAKALKLVGRMVRQNTLSPPI
jgi:hypothetical protein